MAIQDRSMPWEGSIGDLSPGQTRLHGYDLFGIRPILDEGCIAGDQRLRCLGQSFPRGGTRPGVRVAAVRGDIICGGEANLSMN